MWYVWRRSRLSVVSVLLRTHLTSLYVEPFRSVSALSVFTSRPSEAVTLIGPVPFTYCLWGLVASYASSYNLNAIVQGSNAEDCACDSDNNEENNDDIDAEVDDVNVKSLSCTDERYCQDVRTIVDILREMRNGCVELNHRLQQPGVVVSSDLVVEVLSQLRNDWEASFTFFLWATKQRQYAPSVREYHSMISILGKMRKFDTAWSLINDMRKCKNGASLVTPHTLLIMIRRYSAVHDVAKAINTFYAHRRFHFDAGMEEFQNLLCALCRYKNVSDAEHLLFCNKDAFPFNTKSFNIILNGWCNVIVSLREAKRFWSEMGKRGIQYDVVSYASILSCYSNANNLYESLRIFKQMKEMSIVPDRKVYNAMIHALAKGALVREALNLIKKMEEQGITPSSCTYNSVLKPVCKARRVGEAREIFDEMLQRKLLPTNRTFHALFRIIRSSEEVFALLEKMRKLGCHPNSDTYIMLIRKFSRWRQLDNVFKLWNDMSHNGINPDRSAYIVLINGLFLNQKLEEAYNYYTDMIEKLLLPEPQIEDMLKTWVKGKEMSHCQISNPNTPANCSHLGEKMGVFFKKHNQGRYTSAQLGIKTIVRERGFSFWEQ